MYGGKDTMQIRLENLLKKFNETTAVDHVNITFQEGALTALLGPSGCGKSTLLRIVSELQERDGVEIVFHDNTLKENLGFVFQDFNLLDTFSLEDNIFLPLVLAGRSYDTMRSRLGPIAKQLGIQELLSKYPYEVSGGQKQRAAVARALITNPQIILADEPTGALDSRAADNLLDLFGCVNADGQTILMVTHSVKAASHARRVLFLRDGEVYHQLYRGEESQEAMFARISDTLTVLAQGGEVHA